LRNLMKAELFKLKKSSGFKALCICNMASILSSVLLLIAGAEGTGYNALIVSLTYILHHAVIGYLFAAVFLCGEFSNRTLGMSLLCGYSRRKVFLSKILVFLFGLLLLFLIYTGITSIVMSIGVGIGVTYALLWTEANIKEGLLSFVKYTYSYQIGQLQFWGEGFSLWIFMVVTLLTSVIALVTSILMFEKMELK